MFRCFGFPLVEGFWLIGAQVCLLFPSSVVFPSKQSRFIQTIAKQWMQRHAHCRHVLVTQGQYRSPSHICSVPRHELGSKKKLVC
ncbi:hypothetical protein B0T09DRAFT_344064 [Sordaria sp. MPI-SDFR-AT-0083]|nr:hypothetical protein B0T09DRAFT_344064 [Sordaria sp. MPI-SDFR-AT-0083]